MIHANGAARRRNRALRGDGRAVARAGARARRAPRGAHGDRRARFHRARAGGRGRRARAARRAHRLHRRRSACASLREAIAAHYAKHVSAPKFDPTRIAITAGASGGLLTRDRALRRRGRRDPGARSGLSRLPPFRARVRRRARSRCRCRQQTDFQPTLDMVRAAWGPRTKGLLLGSPSNPTGTLISRSELKGIAAFIAERGGVLMVDEIYQGLVYGIEPWTALGLPGEVVLINSFSKYFCMTGWRLGWVVLPRERAARLREARAAPLHQRRRPRRSTRRWPAFSPETPDGAGGAQERVRPAARLPRAGAEEGWAGDPGRAARRVLRLCRLRRRCAALSRASCWRRRRWPPRRGWTSARNGTERYVRFAYTRSMDDLEEAARRLARFAACGP